MKRQPLQSISMSADIMRVVDGRVRPLLDRSLLNCTAEQLARDCYTQGMSDTLELVLAGKFPKLEQPEVVDFQI